MGDDYSKSRWRSFEKTRCLITADGSEDSKIEPEGLTGYTVPPPLQVVSSDQAMQCPIPESTIEEPSEDSESENQEILCMEYEENEQEVVERIDEELDRIYKRPLKNRRVKILYQEWAIERISWYNKKLDEYRVEFEDGTEDYINLDDMNGIEMILLKK